MTERIRRVLVMSTRKDVLHLVSAQPKIITLQLPIPLPPETMPYYLQQRRDTLLLDTIDLPLGELLTMLTQINNTASSSAIPLVALVDPQQRHLLALLSGATNCYGIVDDAVLHQNITLLTALLKHPPLHIGQDPLLVGAITPVPPQQRITSRMLAVLAALRQSTTSEEAAQRLHMSDQHFRRSVATLRQAAGIPPRRRIVEPRRLVEAILDGLGRPLSSDSSASGGQAAKPSDSDQA